MEIFKISGLTDFTKVELLNRNRKSMGAELIPPISELIISLLTLDDILSTIGQEVEISEVEISNEGTFSYKGRKVILYIRDIVQYNSEINLPKYHLVHCSTLKKMWSKNRKERYVVSSRHDGLFIIKYSSNGKNWNEQESALNLCKNCISELNWKNYRFSSFSQKASIFKEFLLADFFNEYANSSITSLPSNSDLTAPINEYPSDFKYISTRFRNSVNWKCDQCRKYFGSVNLRRFLHVHHKDGIKSNNLISNLSALCIECHCRQDNHAHLQSHPDLMAYRQLLER